MKRLLVLGMSIAILSFGNVAVANTPETPNTAPHKLPSSTIDGIDIPFDVLDYAQMKYQGHAITQATRSNHDGREAYQLRVDNDDSLYDDDCIFLWYDMKWKLLDEGKAARQEPRFMAPVEIKNDKQEREREAREELREEIEEREAEQPEPPEEEPEEDSEGPGHGVPRGRRFDD